MDDAHDAFGQLFNEQSVVLPSLTCKQCFRQMYLPLTDQPPWDQEPTALDIDRTQMQSEEWRVVFGCTRCGHIAIYVADDAEEQLVPKRSEAQHPRHPDITVFLVQFSCAETDCRSRFAVHVGIRIHRPSGIWKESNPGIQALRSGVFDDTNLPCGHRYRTIPANFYEVKELTSAEFYDPARTIDRMMW